MKFTKIIVLSSILVASLFAIDTVSNLGANAPHNSTSATNEAAIVFTWTAPANDSKYYWLLDSNATNTYADSYSTDGWQTKTLSGGELDATTITHTLPTVSASGTYYYHVVAVDGSDNTSPTITSSAINIDIDKGTVTMSPDGGALSEVQNLTLTGSETGTVYYTTDGTTPTASSTAYGSPLSIITAKTVKAILVDTAGNIGNVVEKVFTSSVQPTVTTNDASKTTLSGATFATSASTTASTEDKRLNINVSATTTDAGFTRYKYSFNDQDILDQNITIDNQISIPSDLPSGSNALYLQVGDAYNFADAQSIVFNVDNTAPTSLTVSYDSNSTVTKINPENKSNKTTIMSLSATGSSEIKYSIANSAPTTYAVYASTYDTPFELTTTTIADGSEGQVTVQIAAKDASGNWNTSSKTYTIDKQDPVITMPAAKTFAADFVTTVSFDDDGNSSTEDSGSIKYLLEATSACSTTKATTALVNTYSDSITVPAGTTQCLYAIAIDEVGNESNSTSSATTVSTTLFTFSASEPTLSIDLLDNQTFATVTTHGATAVTDINVTGANFETYGYSFDGGSETNTSSLTADNLTNGTAIDIAGLSLSDGDHNVSIKAYKVDSSLGDSAIRYFTVDNTAPSAYTSADYNNDTNYTTTPVTLTLDNVNGDDVYYSDDNTTFTKASVDDNNASQVNITLTQTTTLTTYIEDEAGNQSDRYTSIVTLDIPVQNYSLVAGWNMTVLPSGTIATASLSSPVVWDYNGTDWGNNVASDVYTDITTTSSSKGYWVSLSSSETVQIDGTDISSTFAEIESAASTGWTFAATTTLVSDISSADLVWVYDAGVWKYATTISSLDATLSSLGYTSTTTINAYSAYWIYKL